VSSTPSLHSPFVLSAAALTRSFQVAGTTVHALRDVSLRVPRSRLTILQGPSGSGKTTLINILGALDYPTGGRVEFEHLDIVGLSDHERDELRRVRMGFVFQSVALIGVMSAFENVDFALRVAGYDDAKREQRARDCLSLVGLRGRMDHRPGELSGGEQQRVAIARAIAHEPTLLFADEPTAELDTHTGLQVMALVRRLVQEQGVTVVMSSHDPYIVELADQLVQLEDGRLVQRGDREGAPPLSGPEGAAGRRG
jgi:putative ABC transport system ATP-binding protein